ncbi:nucleotidyl transferase AbiEii/AbiGii toxin family protein [Oerskovia sp. M15]
MVAVVEAIARVDGDDGLEFDGQSPRVDQIREDNEYEGLRVIFTGTLGHSPIRVQLDVSTGDPIIPGRRRSSSQVCLATT